MQEAKPPRLSENLIVCTPFAPREVLRYSLTGVRLPKPFSVTVTSRFSGSTRTAPTTQSSPRREMPMTPRAVRPIGRTLFSLYRTARPSLVAIRTSLSPRVCRTYSSSSPSSSVSAILPPLRWYSNSDSSVRLMMPRLVTMSRYSPSPKPSTAIMAVTLSPSAS